MPEEHSWERTGELGDTSVADKGRAPCLAGMAFCSGVCQNHKRKRFSWAWSPHGRQIKSEC